MPAAPVLSLLSRMVGRRASRGSPTVPPAAADLLDEIGDRWHCWRLRSETREQHRHRVQLHLTTLLIAIEDDLTLLDGLKQLPPGRHTRSSKTRSTRTIADAHEH